MYVVIYIWENLLKQTVFMKKSLTNRRFSFMEKRYMYKLDHET